MQTTTEIKAYDYTIFIGDEVFTDLSNFINREKSVSNKIFILVDENTSRLCLPALINRVVPLKAAEIIEINSGEANKNIETCLHIWQRLSELGADRKSLLINLGGGVITDIGGFAGSTYKRGIDFINIPTTLLSQVDASVGGKTGINLKDIKNQIGVFNNPKAVFIYPDFLKTLGKIHLLSGYAEIIKHGLIANSDLWNEIKKDFLPEHSGEDLGNPESPAWENIITRSIQIKNNIVLEDPKEEGVRKALNFGHTIGHALETHSLETNEAPLVHGEAIAIGMICESYLSWKTVGLSRAEMDEITSFILSKYKPYHLEPTSYNKLLELMKHDKKNATPHASPAGRQGWSPVKVKRDQINFTLLSQIGKPLINESCSVEFIKGALEFYRKSLFANHHF